MIIYNLQYCNLQSFSSTLRKNQSFSSLKNCKQLGYKIIMWDVLSADYDATISAEKCLENVTKNVTSGSIIVFHDSIKAFPTFGIYFAKSARIF